MGQIPGAVAGDIVDHSIYLDTNQSLFNRSGTAGITMNASGMTFTGTLAFPDPQTFGNGTAAAPSIAFTNSTGTGFYRSAANVIGIALAGVAGLAIAGSSPTFAAATDTAGQDVYIKAAAAGGTATAARVGGLINLASGAGSASTGAFAGGAGGAYAVAAGAGGANTGGASGQVGGAGGAYSAAGGAGGATNSTGAHAGGAGGAASVGGGSGGAQTGAAQAGGVGGSGAVTGGPGGASTTGTGGNGGNSSASAGTGGAGVTGGIGGNARLLAGDGGAGGTTGGVGGSCIITAGAGGTGGNVNGGNVTVTPGAPTGSGVRGQIVLAGPLRSPVTGSQSIADSGTIALPTTGFNAIVATSTAANKTGVILAAGIADGQTICIINTSANSLTFAAAGTSNVADGTSAVIPALRAMLFTWEIGSARWYRQGA